MKGAKLLPQEHSEQAQDTEASLKGKTVVSLKRMHSSTKNDQKHNLPLTQALTQGNPPLSPQKDESPTYSWPPS